MVLLKVLVLGIVISILAVFLKQIKPEYSLICIIVGGIILLGYIIGSVYQIFDYFSVIATKTGINSDMFVTMLKIIGIGYLVEFSASVCIDSGNNSIADKIILAGKIIIFGLSMPILTSLFNVIMELL